MKRVLLNFFALIFIGWHPVVSAIVVSDNDELTTDGLGEFRFGMTLDDINAHLVQKLRPSRPELRATANCEYMKVTDMKGIAFVFIDNKLARIDVDVPGIKSMQGIEVGDRFDDVLPKLSMAKREPLDQAPEGSAYIVEAGRQPNAISFQFDNGRLFRMISGNKRVIRYSEGCD